MQKICKTSISNEKIANAISYRSLNEETVLNSESLWLPQDFEV